jgi:uncharacterized protein YjbI with pentapeptide repeats
VRGKVHLRDDWMPGPLTSDLPGLIANGLHVRRNIDLSGTVISGVHRSTASVAMTSAIWLTEARLGGRLLCVGTVIDTEADRAVQADRVFIAGDIRMINGFRANAEIRLIAMELRGSFDLSGANFDPAGVVALDLSEARIGGSVFLRDRAADAAASATGYPGTIVNGRIEMGRATVGGTLHLRNANLRARDSADGRGPTGDHGALVRAAVIAPHLRVDGQILIGERTEVHGALVLDGSTLSGGMQVSSDARISNPGGYCLSFGGATLESLRCIRTRLQGTIDLSDARVTGAIDLSYATLSDANMQYPNDRHLVHGSRLLVDGDLRFDGARALGGALHFRSAEIGGMLEASGAQLHNPRRITLSLHQAQVAGTVQLSDGFRSEGRVVLNRAVIGGRLRCDGASFEQQQEPPTQVSVEDLGAGAAVEVISASVRAGIVLGWTIVAGIVDLTDTHTSYLADAPAIDWPVGSRLSGFTYERFAPLTSDDELSWDVDERIAWLHRLDQLDPQPWHQAAAVFRSRGATAAAEKILIAQRRTSTRQARPAGFALRRRSALVWDRIYGLFGYGYRPWQAIFPIVVLIVAVIVTLAPTPWHQSMRATDQTGQTYAPAGARPDTATTSPALGESPAPGEQPVVGQCGDGRVRCFNPYVYAIDTVVPVIDLGQRSTWYPNRDAGGLWLEVWLDICTIFGWIFSSIAFLSFAKLTRSGLS